MDDNVLVVVGCAVSFIALCGIYVYVRESFIYTNTVEREAKLQSAAPANRLT